jgi:hypothetical protein
LKCVVNLVKFRTKDDFKLCFSANQSITYLRTLLVIYDFKTIIIETESGDKLIIIHNRIIHLLNTHYYIILLYCNTQRIFQCRTRCDKICHMRMDKIYALYYIWVRILSEVNIIKKAHELIFYIWYSEQIFPPSRFDEIITLSDTKEKTEILTWPFATFQKLNVWLWCIHQDVTDQRRVQKPI